MSTLHPKTNPSVNSTQIGLVQEDPWLTPFERFIVDRKENFDQHLADIEKRYGSLEKFVSAYEYLGINYNHEAQGWWYREWAPAANRLYLIGDFNGWDRTSHPLTKTEGGVWEIFLPEAQYASSFSHGSRVKVHVVAANGAIDRIPAYIRRVVQDPESYDFAGQIWHPEEAYNWTDQEFDILQIQEPIIYECHVGMAQEKEGVGTYREFADNVLPRIYDLGYNCIQMMAVMEHPYYGSFGYHVSNFFSPASRFGTPEDLKYLVDEAHRKGIAVIMDVVHSHAVKNLAEGLAEFDGTDYQYFHGGGKGYHLGWDSKLFNYGKVEVEQFLLSNLKYWLEEFHFDGFRFDGVTSMLYHHHGDNVSFNHYDMYFVHGVDHDAVRYLQMANAIIHRVKPGSISIAEDMSGMPGLCRPIEHGGIGFDYRLGMGIPDYWIKVLKHKQDEEWNMHEIWGVLNNRRFGEKTIAYAESHDQAMVGDKTLAFWLMDQEMYWHMRDDDQNLIVDRGLALHKMIRLITLSLGGEGYLNFIGNEFGHPEWIDFPREGNGWSYKYARRQWSLVDDPRLKYKYFKAFDKAMVHTNRDNHILAALPARELNIDSNNQVIIYERNNLVFIFNFHVSRSVPHYRFFVGRPGQYKVILNSDAPQFGGFDRVDETLTYGSFHESGVDQLSIYIPNRTALVLRQVDQA
jgi:1,4-alpha-glucan branching enzyme